MANRLYRRPAVIKRLALACDVAGSRAEWARRNGFTAQYVYAVLSQASPPSDRILKALGLRKVERYEETGR